MKRTLIIISMLITGAVAMAVEGPGTMTFSPTQIAAKPAPLPPSNLDAASRYLNECPKSSYDMYGNLNGYAPINPNFGSRIYNPYGGYANIYHPVIY